jgi:hypothetical protein
MNTILSFIFSHNVFFLLMIGLLLFPLGLQLGKFTRKGMFIEILLGLGFFVVTFGIFTSLLKGWDSVILLVDPLTSLNFIKDHWKAIIFSWLGFSLIGIYRLYAGFGFAMDAKRARDEKRSQRLVVVVDGWISFWYILLDFYLNVYTFSILCLDFRYTYTITLVTARLTMYNQTEEGQEMKWRKDIADVAAAFLDGKDPSGDHILGVNKHIAGLD